MIEPNNVVHLNLYSLDYSNSEGKEKTHEQLKSDLTRDLEQLSDMGLRQKYPREANTHKNMLARSKIHGYKVDKELKKFRSFLSIVGPKRSDEDTLDRTNNDGGYTINNVRWADKKTQNNNRSNNIFISFEDKTHTIGEWTDITGISYSTIYQRYRRKLPPAQILGFESLEPQFSYSREWDQLAPPDPSQGDFPSAELIKSYKKFAKKHKWGDEQFPPSVWVAAHLWKKYERTTFFISNNYDLAPDEHAGPELETQLDYYEEWFNNVGHTGVKWLQDRGVGNIAEIFNWIASK